MSSRHLGSDFDDFLEKESLLEEVNAAAVKRVIAMEVAEAMEERGITKSEMAPRNLKNCPHPMPIKRGWES